MSTAVAKSSEVKLLCGAQVWLFSRDFRCGILISPSFSGIWENLCNSDSKVCLLLWNPAPQSEKKERHAQLTISLPLSRRVRVRWSAAVSCLFPMKRMLCSPCLLSFLQRVLPYSGLSVDSVTRPDVVGVNDLCSALKMFRSMFHLQLSDCLLRSDIDDICLRLNWILLCFMLHDLFTFLYDFLSMIFDFSVQMLNSTDVTSVRSQSLRNDLDPDFREAVLQRVLTFTFLMFCYVSFDLRRITKRGVNDVLFGLNVSK